MKDRNTDYYGMRIVGIGYIPNAPFTVDHFLIKMTGGGEVKTQ